MSKKPAPAPAEYHVDPAALTLRPDLQRICDAASAAPQWDTERDRMKPTPAPAGVRMNDQNLQAILDLMPEVLPALDATNCNISLASNLRAALRALSGDRT